LFLFGKKTQVSGLMTIEKFAGIYDKENVNRLEVTWNSDTIDMIRSKFILRTIQKDKILKNVIERGQQIASLLSQIDEVEGLRSKGLIIGFDLKDPASRDQFMKVLYDKGMICNSTGRRSIRLRPNLNLSTDDALKGCELIKEALQEIS
jgi:L-lysine 6-transaminase